MLHRMVAAVTFISGVLTPASADPSQSSVVAALDPFPSTSVTLGDPVLFSLTLRHQADQRPDRVSPPAFEVDVDVTELASAPGRPLDDGFFETVLSWELRFFELGDHQIPPMEVVLVSGSGGQESLRSAPVEITVASVREDADSEELVDIKPPVFIPGGVPLWLAVVACTLMLAILVALLRWLLGRRHRSGEAALVPPKPTDYIVEFKRIARMGLVERGAYIVYYTLLSQTLRRYLEDRVGVDAMERTTEEVAEVLEETSAVDSAQTGRVLEFLSQADLVKFACAEPIAEDARHAPETGQQIVHAVDALLAAEQEQIAARQRALQDGMKSESAVMETSRTSPGAGE
jgi:hypothetical protein